MSDRVKILLKVITESQMSLDELGDLAREVDTLFWDKANELKGEEQ